MKGLITLSLIVLGAQTTSDDRQAAEEVQTRIASFNEAWEKRIGSTQANSAPAPSHPTDSIVFRRTVLAALEIRRLLSRNPQTGAALADFELPKLWAIAAAKEFPLRLALRSRCSN